MPVPDKIQAEKKQDEELLNRRVESVLNEGITSQEGQQEAPRASKARPPNSGKEPMLLLDKTLKPFGELVYHSDKLDYYECKGVVAPWFLELLVAEMNYFNELAELQFVDPKTCIVTFATEKSLTPGPESGPPLFGRGSVGTTLNRGRSRGDSTLRWTTDLGRGDHGWLLGDEQVHERKTAAVGWL